MGGAVTPDPQFAAHRAAKSGVHGIPSLSSGDAGKGVVWNGTGWENPSLPHLNAAPGFWAPTCRGWQFLAAGYSHQLVSAARFVAPYSMPVTRLGFVCSTLGNNDAVELALFSADGTTKLCTTGSITSIQNTTGVKVPPTTATYNLVGGTVYYAAFWANVNGSPQFVKADMVTGVAAEPFGTTISGSFVATGGVGTWEGCSMTAQASMPSSIATASRNAQPIAVIVRSS